MFSRYTKPKGAVPVLADETDQAGEVAPVGDLGPIALSNKIAATGRPAATIDASSSAVKGVKRRERIEDLKTEMHHRLLDNLNLAAIEKADPTALRQEIVSITTEELSDMGVVLGREDRDTSMPSSSTR